MFFGSALLALPIWALIKTPLKNPDVSIAAAAIRFRRSNPNAVHQRISLLWLQVP
jgi:hypothetical protein